MKRLLTSILLMSGLFMGTQATADKLVINSNQSDPTPRKAWTALVDQFKKENPDIEVEFNTYDVESYKTSIRNWLTSGAPDVVQWYAGERLNTFVSRDLMEDVSDVWQQNNLDKDFASTKSAVSFNGKQYALPWGYYQWGVYYRKDIFEKHNLSVPKTWDDLLNVSATLKSNGVTPFAIGTKYLWTAAGWFDYLNLRVNGIDFHRELMAGKVPYTDQRVKAVFEKWKELIEPGYYLKNHSSYSWQEAIPALIQGKAAMYLMGNFIVPTFPQEDLHNYDYFQFPRINENIAMYEDAPTDIIAIPAIAKNKKDAKRFLAFVSRPEVLATLNQAVGNLSTNRQSVYQKDRFMESGAKVLANAAGVAQFYDRDTRPAMAKVGMSGFQEFMDNPDRMDRILKKIENARKKIFK